MDLALYLQVGIYLYEYWNVIKDKKGLGICPWWAKVFSIEDVRSSTIKAQNLMPLLRPMKTNYSNLTTCYGPPCSCSWCHFNLMVMATTT
jgi:hypothetical protein